jgi:3-oxoacyl-[acyl-carrier protein] reductase
MKKIAIVTGASGGIGRAIALKLITQVNSLILFDIDKEKLAMLQRQLEELNVIQITSYYCDVSESNLVEKTLHKVIGEVGCPNILINNAGIGGPFHKINEVSDDEWFKIINTNLKSIFNLCKILVPQMKDQSYGRIVNIASVQGYLGAAHSSTYVASKHGVIGYTRSIAAEWGAYGITCNAVCPGYVDTNMGIQDQITNHYKKVIEQTPLARIAKPHEIADLVAYLIKDESSFINGSILTIDGGLTCHVGVT